MNRRKYSLNADAREITRQVEMLMLGITMVDSHSDPTDQPVASQTKRRTLDDMRRLSDEIKKAPVYKWK